MLLKFAIQDFKDDREFRENDPGRLDEIFITNRVNNR